MIKAPQEAKIIAEIGCNHMGSIEIAKEMIKTAHEHCKADAVKFQKRDNKTLLSPEQYNTPHPVPHNSFGESYGAHREALEFSLDQHRELKDYCDAIGILYSTSVWDCPSAKELIDINPTLLKVPSASNLNFPLLKELRDNYQGEIHLSTGMTSHKEIAEIITFLEEAMDCKERLVIYACTSGYPVPFEDLCLYEISKLKQLYQDRVKAIGFSGHHNGIAADIAAYTLGATWIERHYTLNRTWKGTDHAASLEPDGLRKLTRDLNAVYKSLNYKNADYLEIEKPQIAKLKKKVPLS